MRTYAGESLNHIAFPLGGMGAGMVCLEGTGALSHVSIRNHPEIFNEPLMFAAISLEGDGRRIARIVEGPVPRWKLIFPWPGKDGSGRGQGGKSYGLPRFRDSSFSTRFPFATVKLSDRDIPIGVSITGWSPFLPGNADDSSLPFAAVEYTLRNTSAAPAKGIFSYHAQNFVWLSSYSIQAPSDKPVAAVERSDNGFTHLLKEHATEPWLAGAFNIETDSADSLINCRWFRGGWFDALTTVWRDVELGSALSAGAYTEGAPSPGGSLFIPFDLAPGESKIIRLRMSWHFPRSSLRNGKGRNDANETSKATHQPWYASRFANIAETSAYWATHYARLREESLAFSDCFFDITLPAEVVEAVSANLTILKSPTILRQADGRLWLWEGSNDTEGSCEGSCTHVWNYAQAIAHLFPSLERGLRDSEFHENQDERGHQIFRATLPIRQNTNEWHAAADGQLGGIMKVHRDWRVSGDTQWLRELWPFVKRSLDYCINTWDPDHEGLLKEPHHSTYDIEFWGPNGMTGTFYAGALKAASVMGSALAQDVSLYEGLFEKARCYLESDLFNGEYFIQKIRWRDLHAAAPSAETASWNVQYSPEALAILRNEGPKYQYGNGCLSDGVLGAWIAEMCGIGEIVDPVKVRSHLLSVCRHNFRETLIHHANPQRAAFAVGDEPGLLLCSWPRGDRPALPFIYSDEVWTGIEYHVASHLILHGCIEEGLRLVRAARSRYDGRIRNPFAEIECGHWYGRALSSYGLLQSLTGQRYDAVSRTLHLRPVLKGDWRSFLCTATGYGTIEMRNGKPSLTVKRGVIPVDRIEMC
jgi:uncharacterized protein (DUF608 family)